MRSCSTYGASSQRELEVVERVPYEGTADPSFVGLAHLKELSEGFPIECCDDFFVVR